jgi:hypothetical protein
MKRGHNNQKPTRPNIYRGPFGTVYACPHCKHTEKTNPGRGQGRGHGLRTGGAAFSRVSAHIKKEHPRILKG